MHGQDVPHKYPMKELDEARILEAKKLSAESEPPCYHDQGCARRGRKKASEDVEEDEDGEMMTADEVMASMEDHCMREHGQSRVCEADDVGLV